MKVGGSAEIKDNIKMLSESLNVDPTARPNDSRLSRIHPKFLQLRDAARKIDKVLCWLSGQSPSFTWVVDNFPDIAAKFNILYEFMHSELIESFENMIELTPREGLGDPSDYACISEEDRNAFNAAFCALESCKFVDKSEEICALLSRGAAVLLSEEPKIATSQENLAIFSKAAVFEIKIDNSPPIDLIPMARACINSAEDSHTFTLLMYKLHTRTKDLYEAKSIPEFDIDGFVKVACTVFGSIKHAVPGCDEMLDALSNSAHIMRKNFGEYNKTLQATKNPLSLMECFVQDISKNQQASKTNLTTSKTIIQTRKILSFLRSKQKSEGKKVDPKIEALIAAAHNRLGDLQKMDDSADSAADTAADSADSAADTAADSAADV